MQAELEEQNRKEMAEIEQRLRQEALASLKKNIILSEKYKHFWFCKNTNSDFKKSEFKKTNI